MILPNLTIALNLSNGSRYWHHGQGDRDGIPGFFPHTKQLHCSQSSGARIQSCEAFPGSGTTAKVDSGIFGFLNHLFQASPGKRRGSTAVPSHYIPLLRAKGHTCSSVGLGRSSGRVEDRPVKRRGRLNLQGKDQQPFL